MKVNTSNTSAPLLNAPVTPEKAQETSLRDRWLGVARFPLRTIDNTPYFLSRMNKACIDNKAPMRLNKQGYDMDNPQDALVKYEQAHPETWLKKTWDELCDFVFNAFVACVPKLLSLSAGADKQRIDQKVVLQIVRESVDKFPELKIRISKEKFSLLSAEDQRQWHAMMALIRQAQHDYVTNELAKAYPGHIDQNAPTILYTGGRATGLLRVLYCSVDEYVALYWSDWGLMSTDSGSYKAHVYDYITEGHNINWSGNPQDFNTNDYEITEPGEYTFLGKGDRKIWSFEGPCGMVDHGIGDIISMTKFALVSNFSSTLNLEQVGKLLSTEARAVAHEYAQRLRDTFGATSVKLEDCAHVSLEDLEKAREYFAPIINQAKKA